MNKNALFAVVFAGLMLVNVSNVSAETNATEANKTSTGIVETITNSRFITHLKSNKKYYAIGAAALVGAYFVCKHILCNQEEIQDGDMTKVRYKNA